MARTTDELVEGIIEVDATIVLTPFITVANYMVTEYCDGLDDPYEAAHLIEIETWLAAHFYTIRDPRAESEKAGSVAEKFQSKVDLGLSTSHYGQTAMILDFQGGLAAMNDAIKNGNTKSPSATWLGTEDTST